MTSSHGSARERPVVAKARGPKSPATRAGLALLLAASALYYLQFGLQALVHYLPQGVLALVGAVALGWAAVRVLQRKPASSVVCWGTMPLLLLHLAMTVQDPGELPFLMGSAPAPLAAGTAWFIFRRRPARDRRG